MHPAPSQLQRTYAEAVLVARGAALPAGQKLRGDVGQHASHAGNGTQPDVDLRSPGGAWVGLGDGSGDDSGLGMGGCAWVGRGGGGVWRPEQRAKEPSKCRRREGKERAQYELIIGRERSMRSTSTQYLARGAAIAIACHLGRGPSVAPAQPDVPAGGVEF